MPRTAYLIPGRGGKWGGRCRDFRRRRFRRRRFRRRRRRLRSSGWVAAGGRATHPPASQPAGRPAALSALPELSAPCPNKIFDSEIPGSAKKISNFEPLIILWHLIGAITPSSILIFIAAFEFGLQKPMYIDSMQAF